MSANTTDVEFKIGLSDADKAAMQAAITALVKASLITAYSSSATYALGDFVYYDGKFYKCTTAISTAEAWTSGHWTEATLNDVINKVNQAANSVENKVDPDDICPELRAGYAFTADNLNATKGLTVNDDPMSYGIVGGAQKSAVGDGNASLNKLVCVDVVRNQWVNKNLLLSTQTINGITITNNGDGTLTFSGTATANVNQSLNVSGLYMLQVAGHRVLINQPRTGSANFYIRTDTGGAYTYDQVKGISTVSGTNINWIVINITNGTTVNERVPILIYDITQRYGSNGVVDAIIGTDASKQVENLLAFDPEILSDTDYDAGTLVPSKTAKLLSVGVNQWDEETEITGNDLITKNPIKVIPNTQYFIRVPYSLGSYGCTIKEYDGDNLIRTIVQWTNIYTASSNANSIIIEFYSGYGTTYNNDICINVSDANINGKYYPSKRNPVPLPNYEGHGILKVVDGKVVADGDELYPDGNSKKRYRIVDLGTMNFSYYSNTGVFFMAIAEMKPKGNIACAKYTVSADNHVDMADKTISTNNTAFGSAAYLFIKDSSFNGDTVAFKTAMSGVYLVYELATEEDTTTPVYQSTFPVEQGGTLQFLDEDDNPIAGLQGSEIFYQKNIKAFVEALGEATNWDPERIERLGDLSFTPEYVDIPLNPSFEGAYSKAQVYNASFTIVISTNVTGTPNGSITFQDSEIDLSNFQTNPADRLYDMDGKKVSEAPTTPDCSIAPFVGRSKNGYILWSLLHSGVNKVKIHIEEAVPLDSEGKGKIDCRTNMIL